MRVEEREVGHDDGHGQGQGQHAGQSAQSAHEHADVGLGHHVPEPHRCHGDQSPPQPLGYAVEVVAGVELDALGVVDERGEDDDAEHEEEDEEDEFLGRSLERVYEDLEAGRVPRQLAQPHDADDGEELQHVALPLQGGQDEVQVEAERGHHVYDVDRLLHEAQFAGRHHEAQDDLEGEPGVAGALDVEESLEGLRLLLAEAPGDGAVADSLRDVEQDGYPHVRVGLEAEGQDGQHDEEHRDDGDHLQDRMDSMMKNTEMTAITSKTGWTA